MENVVVLHIPSPGPIDGLGVEDEFTKDDEGEDVALVTTAETKPQ